MVIKTDKIGVLKTELDLRVDEIRNISINWEKCIKQDGFKEEEIRMISEFEGLKNRRKILYFRNNANKVKK